MRHGLLKAAIPLGLTIVAILTILFGKTVGLPGIWRGLFFGAFIALGVALAIRNQIQLTAGAEIQGGIEQIKRIAEREDGLPTCQAVLRDRTRCKRKSAKDENFCWQHAHGLKARWRSLTRSQSVIFVIGVLGLVATIAMGLYPILYRETSAADRAYVSFVGFGNAILNNSPSGQVWGYMFPLLWANTGPTPTVGGKMQVGHRLSNEALPNGFDYLPVKPAIDFNVGPKLGGACDYNFQLNDLIAIQQHTSRYFIWGTFAYHDVVPKSPVRLHEFCIEITDVMHSGGTDLANPANVPVLKYGNCKEHNCNDETCADYGAFTK